MVADEPIIIHVDPDSDIARQLESAGDHPVVLEVRGTRYRIARIPLIVANREDLWSGYDADRARAATLRASGSWKDLDVDEIKDYIYRAREEGSRPPDRP